MPDEPVIDVSAVVDDALRSNAAARAELLDAFDRIPDARRIEVWYGTWALKDILAHLVGWQEANAIGLEQMANGERPAIPGWEGDDDSFNAKSVERFRDEPWERVLGALRTARERHEEVARSLDGRIDPSRLEPDKTAHRFLFAPGNHDREHIPAILEWRRAQGL
jgi:uncharacterized damage-inducible protein DinB